MISRLSISNYALIENSGIDFDKGFTVITGETGAGKSIMLDALSLLMGARADSRVMGNKEKKTVVEASFLNPDSRLNDLFSQNNIDWDDKELVIRREISPSGKSRSFVNDTPVNLSLLSEISERLIDIHSQHSNSLLNKSQEQLSIIDSYGKIGELLESYRNTFRQYVALRNRIKKIKERRAQGKENREFILFRLEQLDKLKPKRGEIAVLEREAEILGDADTIKNNLQDSINLISGGNGAAIRSLQLAYASLSEIDLSLLDSHNSDNILERIDNLKVELRDISDTLEGYSEKINSDPEKLDRIQSRIESLYEAMKRFKVKDENELVDLYTHLKEELKEIDGEGEDETELEFKLKEFAKELKEQAEKLTNARQIAAKEFSETIEERIIPLGLPNVKFHVAIEKGKMSQDGQDILTFYCSFNKNHALQPVSEIASGGEISRVMLGIKSVMAEKMELPTVIFDEIDTGVSGEIAHKMGKMMKEMSDKLQVITVTHLPQVAANGDSHLKVYKADDTEKTVSHIKRLSDAERVNEIAGMLSGTSINKVAIENAKILLNSN
ncbi:MAG: DNA repair protein RecN [Muribaculaceae bacterium]|nr:DNA repair protein RecN [Muribaculaceae bacterium]